MNENGIKNGVGQSPQVGMAFPEHMTFGQAMEKVLAGKQVRRLEWEDDRFILSLQNNQVMVFKPEDSKFHPLIISTGDLSGTDWVVSIGEQMVH